MSMSSIKWQTGLTMVELLVALAVGLFLTAGIIQLMANSNQASRSVNASSFVQENARFALATLAHDIRMAGFLGCRSLSDDALVVRSSPSGTSDFRADVPTDGPGRPFAALIGYSAGDAPDWVPSTITPVTDVSLIQTLSAQGTGTVLAAAQTSANGELVLAGNPDGLRARDVAVITDCESVDIFTVNGVSGNAVQHSGLGRSYLAGARVFPLIANGYVIGKRANSPCAEQSCLYKVPLGRRDASGGRIAAQDLVAAEELKLRFGVVAGGGVSYDDADGVWDDGVSNWSAVQTVRIGLLVGSDASDPDRRNVTSTPQKYVFQDPADQEDLSVEPDPITATDRRLRIPYWATVTLRNSLP
jgi:type IV pilus assembly protein PilW